MLSKSRAEHSSSFQLRHRAPMSSPTPTPGPVDVEVEMITATLPLSENEDTKHHQQEPHIGIDDEAIVDAPQDHIPPGGDGRDDYDVNDVNDDDDDSTLKRKRDADEQQQQPPTPQDTSNPPNDPMRKTSLCSFFRRNSGSCSHGDTCRYAHGEAELRPRPDNSWDPTSLRAKKLLRTTAQHNNNHCIPPPVDMVVEDILGCTDNDAATALEKCLVSLPMRWTSDSLKTFLDDQGIPHKMAKKKKGMTVGFLSFTNTEQLDRALERLEGITIAGRDIKVADVMHRSFPKRPKPSNQQKFQSTEIHSGDEDATVSSLSCIAASDDDDKGQSGEGLISKTRTVRDVVTPLAHMPYSEQLEYKKSSLLQILKKLTQNARKACPDAVPLPEWIHKSRDIGRLPCELEGIIQSPLANGYRNKCEFSVGYSLQGKKTVGFVLGNFREGMTAVEEPFDCPNVSRISCQYAVLFQDFLQSSELPVWNRINNAGFWRQLTVREGRDPGQASKIESAETQIAEVMLIIQVCSLSVDEEVMNSEFQKMAQNLAQGASACSPPLPLSALVVQDHKGISNAAPADCPLISLSIPDVERASGPGNQDIAEARIHDYICNLRFCISPTAFFQVNTLAAEKLYTVAGDWARLSLDTLLFDICCGTGTIGLTLAHRVGMVVGIEMNSSAVSDAQRNAAINGIKNCRFICAKAEDVMGALLKEYLDVSQQAAPSLDAVGGRTENIDSNKAKDTCDNEVLHSAASISPDALVADLTPSSEDMTSENGKQDLNVHGESSGICNKDTGDDAAAPTQSMVLDDTNGSPCFLKNCTSESIKANEDSKGKEGFYAPIQQFKDVVAIVDPPRVGLHPVVIKALRTHPRLRRLVYISCNPESLVANAIELCTPTTDKPQKGKSNRGWRNMSSAGLARHRTKSMPMSEPFKPVRAMAVDLFPHTPHCEMVMLFER